MALRISLLSIRKSIPWPGKYFTTKHGMAASVLKFNSFRRYVLMAGVRHYPGSWLRWAVFRKRNRPIIWSILWFRAIRKTPGKYPSSLSNSFLKAFLGTVKLWSICSSFWRPGVPGYFFCHLLFLNLYQINPLFRLLATILMVSSSTSERTSVRFFFL